MAVGCFCVVGVFHVVMFLWCGGVFCGGGVFVWWCF